MKINKIVLTKDTFIRLGTSYSYGSNPQMDNIKGIYSGGEPIVRVPAGTELRKFKTEYGASQYDQNLEDFASLLKQFSFNIECKSYPYGWEGITLEEKYPEYKNALFWSEIPFTEDWREDEEDLGDIRF